MCTAVSGWMGRSCGREHSYAPTAADGLGLVYVYNGFGIYIVDSTNDLQALRIKRHMNATSDRLYTQ